MKCYAGQNILTVTQKSIYSVALLLPDKERYGKVMFSVMFVFQSIQKGGSTWPLPVMPWTSPQRELFDLFKLGPHCTETPTHPDPGPIPPPPFGWLASYWNSFLLMGCFRCDLKVEYLSVTLPLYLPP